MTSALAAMYDTTTGMGKTAYYSPSGQDLSGMPTATKQTVAEEVSVLISYGAGDEADGADDLDAVARIRVRVSDVATMEHGAQFFIGTELWQVTGARKSADGLEWIVEASRLLGDI